MSSWNSKRPRPQKKSAKVAAALVLGVVFIWILLFDSSGRALEDASATSEIHPAIPSEPASQLTPTSGFATLSPPQAMVDDNNAAAYSAPETAIDINQIIAQNPFVRSTLNPFHGDAAGLAAKNDSSGLASDESNIAIKQADVGSHTDEAQPVVQAIVAGADRSAVLINNKPYFERDIVDGRWQIVSIFADEVLMAPAPKANH